MRLALACGRKSLQGRKGEKGVSGEDPNDKVNDTASEWVFDASQSHRDDSTGFGVGRLAANAAHRPPKDVVDIDLVLLISIYSSSGSVTCMHALLLHPPLTPGKRAQRQIGKLLP